MEFNPDDTEEVKPRCRTSSPASSLQLPQQAGEPEVQRQSAAEFPILSISLAAGDEDLDAPTTYAWDEAIPRLEEVEDVARVVSSEAPTSG